MRRKKYTTEEIIEMLFGPKPKPEISDVPKGWDDGYPRGTQTAQIEYYAYQRLDGINYEPTELHTKFLERNFEQDPEDILLKKQIENIQHLPNFKEWNFK